MWAQYTVKRFLWVVDRPQKSLDQAGHKRLYVSEKKNHFFAKKKKKHFSFVFDVWLCEKQNKMCKQKNVFFFLDFRNKILETEIQNKIWKKLFCKQKTFSFVSRESICWISWSTAKKELKIISFGISSKNMFV